MMLFGDERFEDIKPRSLLPGDTAKIEIRSFEFGKHLQEMDINEDIFHIELFPETSPPYCEIWLAFEWKESNARTKRIKAASAENREIREKSNVRIEILANQLKSRGFTQAGFANHLAKEILANWKQNNFDEMLNTLKLFETLKTFDDEDKGTL